MGRLDPRTRLALGLTAMAAVFVARKPETLVVESIILLATLPLLGLGKEWAHSFRYFWPMLGLVFVIAFFSFNLQAALLLATRLFNLLTVSFVFFRTVTPEEMGATLNKLGLPYGFAFILTTAMRYVPLIRLKIRHIIDAQSSRGIDLRPRLRNVGNFMALLMPLLAQSFVLSDELAVAMESRGFGRKGRSSRRQYDLTFLDCSLMVGALLLLVLFAFWERR
ncbi:MAG: energy-coupling factor transporter transmembrane component T [Deltaproteobacteria bacterium]